MKHNGVTNDELEMCAGCDYRLSYDELRDENIKLQKEIKEAYEIIDWKFIRETNDTCGAMDLSAEEWLIKNEEGK